MAIKLIHPDERFTAKIADCEFDYRRLPDDVEDRIRAENTNNGKLDNAGYMQGILSYCVLTWRGVTDHAGEAVAFDPLKFKSFPSEPLKDLVRTIMFSVAGERVERRPTDPF